MSDCPICLNEFSAADTTYPLRCPTTTCHFNYCSDCIRQLQKSAADGYQVASDGSRQVKVQLQCPQCREKYQCEKYPSDVILSSVLLLRRAACLQESVLQQSDSELSATELSNKHAFLHSTSMEELEDAVRRLQLYEDQVLPERAAVVPALDWDLWRPHVPDKKATGPQQQQQSEQQHKPTWSDPSLFCGLDELMSQEEQDFVTTLLTSRQVDSLQQASLILHGILVMTATTPTLRHCQNNNHNTATTAVLDPQTRQRIRKRYPLPSRMPRCVRLPITTTNHHHSSPPPPLENCFANNNNQKKKSSRPPLTLTRVKGPAGRVGLRPHDVVTHVDGNAVTTVEDYYTAITSRIQHASGGEEAFVMVTVNADQETADALWERAQTMQRDRVNFFVSWR